MEYITPERLKREILKLSKEYRHKLGYVYTSRERIPIGPTRRRNMTLTNCGFPDRGGYEVNLQYRTSGQRLHSFTGEIKFIGEIKDEKDIKKRDKERGKIEMLLLKQGIQPEIKVSNPSKITITHIEPESLEGIRRFISAYFEIQRELRYYSHRH